MSQPLYDSYSPEPKTPASHFQSPSPPFSPSIPTTSQSILSPQYTPNPKPSTRAQSRVQSTDTYLRTIIEPIISSALEAVIFQCPNDVRGGLLTHFLSVSSGSAPQHHKQKETKEARLAVREKAGKILSSLAVQCVKVRPDDIVSFLVTQLEKQETEEDADMAFD